MFAHEIHRDEASKKITRRTLAAGTAAVLGWFALSRWRRVPGVEASTEIHGTPGIVAIADFKDDGTPLGLHNLPRIVKSDGDWYKQLGANSFGILRQADTEMPGFGANLNEHRKGIFRCLGCDTALFLSTTKFDSGTGWPSFYASIARQNVLEKTDRSLGMERTEVTCARCDGHLGHVFDDGPQPTGLRFCMNSASLRFSPA